MYWCAINLFWCDGIGIPAVGKPVRPETVTYLMDHYFAKPTRMPHELCIALDEKEEPLKTKDTWKFLSPQDQELMHAMVGAIARDIKRGLWDVLPAWRTLALCTMAKFRVFRNHEAKLGQAIDNLIGTRYLHDDDPSMKPTTLMSIHTVVAFRDMLNKRHGWASAEQIAKLSGVDRSIVDAAITIIDSQVLSIPAAEKLLLRMECKGDRGNPFWPIHRLQAIVDRAKQDRDLLLWFLHAIVHMVEYQNVPATDVSLSTDLLSRAGTLDLLAFKKAAHEVIFHRLAFSLGVDGGEGGEWLIEGKLYHHSHEHYYGSHTGEALVWRNKLNDVQARFIKFAEDVLYGSRYDNQIKKMLWANKAASQMETDEGFVEALQEIKSLHVSADHEKEKGALDLTDNPTDTGDDEGKKDLVLDIHMEAGGDGSEPCSGKSQMKIPWAELPPEAKSEYQRAEAYLKSQLSIYVRLLHVPNGDDPLAPLLLTPAGKYVPDDGGIQPKFVGIICDMRVLGESSHRPAIRLPPINYETVQALLNAVRGRHGEEYINRLHPSDLYMTLAGGRELPKLNRWFTKLDQTHAVVSTRTVLVYFKEESVVSRYTRVSGVGSAKTHDTLRLTAQPWPAGKLRSVDRIHYPGHHDTGRQHGSGDHAAAGRPATGLACKLGHKEEDLRPDHRQGWGHRRVH